MARLNAVEVTRLFWEARRPDMIRWLINERGFNPVGAEKCARNFIDTMIYVASQTGEPQFKRGT